MTIFYPPHPAFPAERWVRGGASPDELVYLESAYDDTLPAWPYPGSQFDDVDILSSVSDQDIATALAYMRQTGVYTVYRLPPWYNPPPPPPPSVSVTTATIPGGVVGVPYSVQFTAQGGTTPYVWTVNGGSLPAGLTLSSSGLLSGTPTTAGASLFGIHATDSSMPPLVGVDLFAIVVQAAVPVITITTGSTLPGGTVGVHYSVTCTATGGTPPYSWTVSAGSLPAGLTLHRTTGVLSGTPTATGTSSFTLMATDSTLPTALTATASVSLTITPAATLVITTASLPTGTVGTAYSKQLAATGGTTPYTWSVISGTLPAGLTLSSSGLLSGTPSAVYSASVTIQATDSSGTPLVTSAVFPMVIQAALAVTTGNLPVGTVGTPYTYQLQATGGSPPYTWALTIGTLPPGLTVSTSGLISGTPTAAAYLIFTVEVTDSVGGTNSAPFLMAIHTGNTPPPNTVYGIKGTDPAVQIAAMASGWTWDGQGGDYTTAGIVVTQPATIQNFGDMHLIGWRMLATPASVTQPQSGNPNPTATMTFTTLPTDANGNPVTVGMSVDGPGLNPVVTVSAITGSGPYVLTLVQGRAGNINSLSVAQYTFFTQMVPIIELLTTNDVNIFGGSLSSTYPDDGNSYVEMQGGLGISVKSCTDVTIGTAEIPITTFSTWSDGLDVGSAGQGGTSSGITAYMNITNTGREGHSVWNCTDSEFYITVTNPAEDFLSNESDTPGVGCGNCTWYEPTVLGVSESFINFISAITGPCQFINPNGQGRWNYVDPIGEFTTTITDPGGTHDSLSTVTISIPEKVP
ncbi:MAG TPA: Ig domain-containing protein [Acidimicrobiales bacterium]|nr:Ig domain-containing protein [Acidimicrobiales bacterium]